MKQVEKMLTQIREITDREKELSGLKSRLLMMALHEFRSPLTTIYSSAELISRYTRTNEQAERERHVERIKSCVDKFLLTLDDFQLLDECAADKIKIRRESFNVFSLCQQVIREVEGTYNAQLIRYTHTSSTALVKLDPRLLTFIVRQLLQNAIKFSHEKHVVTMKTSIINTLLELSVSDKGIGIPKTEQQFLFEPFFRASNALNIPGTGVGLCLVNAYTRKMNGTIVIESEKDAGAVFKVLFQETGCD